MPSISVILSKALLSSTHENVIKLSADSSQQVARNKILRKKIRVRMPVTLISAALPLSVNAIQPDKYDVLIKNGSVVDGTGAARFSADVGIKGGKIIAVGDLQGAAADDVINAAGLIVCPGFIDPHTHPEDILSRPDALNYMHQGVTLVLGGNCGGGAGTDLAGFLDSVVAVRPAINYATLVGQGDIRTEVMGSKYEAPTEAELEAMKGLVATAMCEGAFGLSTGLEYYPGLASSTEEIIALAKVADQYGGVYASHLRDEESVAQGGYGVINAVEEAIKIGEQSGIPVEISHIKVNGADMWYKSDEVLAMITDARSRGVDITYDEYPWDGSSTNFTTFLPAWVSEPFRGSAGGQEAILARIANPEQRAVVKNVLQSGLGLLVGSEFGRILISRCSWNQDFVGTNLQHVMDVWGLPSTAEGAAEAVIQVIAKGGGGYISRTMNDYDIENFMRQPFGMICDDAGIPDFGVGSVHPRGYGSYAKILSDYVREKGVLTLEQAIYKMTYMPAEKFGFLELGRGLIKEGFHADVTVFNPETVEDKATYLQPFQYAEGFKAVLVNGEIALLDDVYLKVHAGQVLRHTHRHPSSPT